MRSIQILAGFFGYVAIYALSLAAIANAQPPLTITDAGYFITVVGDDGVPRLVQITTIVDLRGGGDTPSPPDKKPDVDAELVKQVKSWAGSVEDPQTAQAIAAVYSHVRGAVADGKLATAGSWDVLKQATDCAIAVVGSDADWQPFRDELSAVITEGKQRGTLSGKPEIVRLLRSVQAGLELSADGSDALALDKLAEIARKTNEAIDGA